MTASPGGTKPTSSKKEEAKAKQKIEAEMGKVNTALGLGNFAGITTYEEFLSEAKKIFAAFNLPFDPKRFKYLKQEKSNGTNKKSK